MGNLDYEAWRCHRDDAKFCPEEGCPKSYGCARDKGWKFGDPSPPECRGIVVPLRPFVPATGRQGFWTWRRPDDGR